MAIPTNVKPPVANNSSDKLSALLGKAKDVKDTVSSYHCAMFWGETKTGKTTLGCDYEKPLVLLEIGGENGTASVQTIDGIKVIPIDTWDEFETMYWYLTYSEHPYKTVVIDTITKLQDIAVEKVLTEKGKSVTAIKTWEDWGSVASLMKTYLQYYKNLATKMNVVFLGQYKEIRTNGEIPVDSQLSEKACVALMPSIQGFVESLVDINGYVHVANVRVFDPKTGQTTNKVKHCLKVLPDGIYSVGIRLPYVGAPCPDRIVDPNYQKIKAIVNPEKK
jgi:hypothetical protein